MNTILNELILKNEPILKKLANNFTTDNDDKDDLVQETFIRSLKSLPKFINHPKLISWLYVIMKNIYLNKYRRESLYRIASDEIEYTQSRTATNQAESSFVIKDIEKAMHALTKDNYDIFCMYIEGFKYHEIASYMQIKEGTIKTRIHSIRKILKKKLSVYTPAERI